MPLFDYECIDCQHLWEQLERKCNEKIVCPKCKSKNIKKLIANFSVTFKGTGFYETDYKNKQ